MITPYVNGIFGDHRCGFRRQRSTTDQIVYSRLILEKKWEYNGTVHQLFIDFKKNYDSVKREVIYNILLEFGITKKLVRLIKMCLNETYSKVLIGKVCHFLFRMGWKKGCSIAIAFQFCFRICHEESPKKSNRFGIEWDTSAIDLCWWR
jgi:hypothetical protein